MSCAGHSSTFSLGLSGKLLMLKSAPPPPPRPPTPRPPPPPFHPGHPPRNIPQHSPRGHRSSFFHNGQGSKTITQGTVEVIFLLSLLFSSIFAQTSEQLVLHTHTHTRKHARARAHTHSTISLSLSLSLSLSHTHTHTHTHTNARSRASTRNTAFEQNYTNVVLSPATKSDFRLSDCFTGPHETRKVRVTENQPV